MKSQVLWLRVAYWVGVFLDAKACAWMLSPRPVIAMSNTHDYYPGWDYRYAMAFGAALMAGWTVLLIWADRKPIERRGVLLITICPVIVGLNLSRYFLYWGGYIPTPFSPSSLVLPFVLITLFLFAYLNSLRGQRVGTAT